MSIVRHGVGAGQGAGRRTLPFAKAVEADGWLHVFGQTPTRDGEVVGHGIVEQAEIAIENLLAIVREAGYGVEDIVRVGVWLDDARDFWSFNGVFQRHFGEHPPHAPASSRRWSSIARSKWTASPIDGKGPRPCPSAGPTLGLASSTVLFGGAGRVRTRLGSGGCVRPQAARGRRHAARAAALACSQVRREARAWS